MPDRELSDLDKELLEAMQGLYAKLLTECEPMDLGLSEEEWASLYITD